MYLAKSLSAPRVLLMLLVVCCHAICAAQTPTSAFPDMPRAITSFGAAIHDGHLYTYGGHTGSAHHYYTEAQSNTLHRLSVTNPMKWEEVATGPRLQGLALVSDGQHLYRLGGFTAKNTEGQKQDLWSQPGVARFDPKSGQWADMPPLPEPRSSFDAVVLGTSIFVVGGWSMQGAGSEALWHQTAWQMDLSQPEPKWTAIAKLPLRRRAVGLAVHQDKVYALGGMQKNGKPTTRVDVYDPKTNRWEQSHNLLGKPLNGFGVAGFSTGENLYVTTMDGSVQRLDAEQWVTVSNLETGRFFHRMLPIQKNRFVLLGGANMEIGKFEDVEQLDVP